MHILGIKVSGYRMLKDNFTIDFRNKAKVDPDYDYENEVAELLPKLDYPRTIIFTGPNASGKTTILGLIGLCLEIAVNGCCLYRKQSFAKDTIELEFVFELNKILYKYKGIIAKASPNVTMPDSTRFCTFLSEEITTGKEVTLKKENIFEGFNAAFKTREDFKNSGILPYISVCNILYPRNDNLKCGILLGTNFPNDNYVETLYYFRRFFSLPENLQKDILKLLDDSIESLTVLSRERGQFSLKRHGEEKAHTYILGELLKVLSSGTSKGIILFAYAYHMLRFGGILIVDELENSFHSSLVSELIFLFNNEDINKTNATLIFSTHYSALLDSVRRRDAIFICHRGKDGVDATNMYKFGIRSELSKSNLYDSNHFNNLSDYETVMDLREDFDHEISNYLRGQK